MMKNSYSFYGILLAFILFACAHCSAAALDYKVPPKPKECIADDAQLFDAVGLSDLQSMCGRKVLNRVVIKPYVLTLNDKYWNDVDAISKMVCKAWGICGTDPEALLIMSNGTPGRFMVVTGDHTEEQLSDTLLSFMVKEKLPALAKQKGYADAAKHFILSIQLDMYNPQTNFLADYTSQKFYEEYEGIGKTAGRLSLQTEYADYAKNYGKAPSATGTLSRGFITAFMWFSVLLSIAYLVVWARYKKAQ